MAFGLFGKEKGSGSSGPDYYPIRDELFSQWWLSGTAQWKLVAETKGPENAPLNSLDFAFGQKETGRYHFVVEATTSEATVGISSDTKEWQFVPWELHEDNASFRLPHFIFTGWGTGPEGTANINFEGHLIGIGRQIFVKALSGLMSQYPDFFPISKMQNAIGLEGLSMRRA